MIIGIMAQYEQNENTNYDYDVTFFEKNSNIIY